MPPLRRPQATLCICGRAPPSLPPCFTFFLPLHRPLSEGLGQVSQRSKPRPHIQKLAPLMLPPSYLPSLKPLPRNFFSLYTAPSQEASGKSLYMWPGFASPERLRRPPPLASPASNSFSLYTAPLRRPWASLCICLPSLKPLPWNIF